MKRLVFTFYILFHLALLKGQDFQFKFNEKTDLNSDGIADDIQLKSNDDNLDFILVVNGKEIKGNIGDQVNGLIVADINKADKYKEIAVHTPGPSDDDVYMLYWYDGSDIIPLIQLSGWPEFPGTGIVYVKSWEGFWSPVDKYRLENASRKMLHVEQFAYYIGLKIKIKKGFKIFREKELQNEVALLGDNSEIEIILCDKKGYGYDEYRYLVKSVSGLLGWSDFKTMESCIDFPMAD